MAGSANEGYPENEVSNPPYLKSVGEQAVQRKLLYHDISY
jgi:hypothetical protein